MRFKVVLFITAIIALILYSCREKGGKFINEGEIHYKIDYTGSFIVPKEALPQDLIFAFKRNKILFEMTGIGKSGIMNLTNPEKGIYDTYFSFFAKKYYYAGERDELYPGFEAMKGLILKKTSRKSVICGYNCLNAEVTFPSDRKKVRDIWYTTEIKVKDPNVSTPFSQIDGVLMSFFFLIGTSELDFRAETVYSKEEPDELFERRDKYIKVSKDSIKDFINRLISI